MRLQKYIAMCGVCSRRKAEELISAGRVAVNGVTASLKVEVMYLDVTTSLPARTTAKSAISSNLSQIDTIRQSASSGSPVTRR